MRMKNTFSDSKFSFIRDIFRRTSTVFLINLAVMISCISLFFSFAITAYAADTQDSQTDPKLSNVEFYHRTISTTTNIYFSYYKKSIEYSFSNPTVGKFTVGTASDEYKFVPDVNLKVDWIEWSKDKDYRVILNENFTERPLYTYDSTDNIMRDTGSKTNSSMHFNWCGMMAIGGELYYKVSIGDNNDYWINSRSTVSVGGSKKVSDDVQIKKYTLSYGKNYVAKDVTLNTNLGKKNITVVGDKGETTSASVPEENGYTPKPSEIDFKFDEDGNITPENPEVDYVSDDIKKIPDRVNMSASWNGQEIPLSSDEKDSMSMSLTEEDKEHLLRGKSLDIPSNSSSIVDIVNFETKEKYELKWDNEKKQLYLIDSNNDIIWINNEGNVQDSLPVNIISLSMIINYYDIDNQNKMIGSSTITAKPDEKNNFTFTIPSQPSDYASNDYKGKYEAYTGESSITLNEKDIKIPQSPLDMVLNSVFYQKVYLQSSPIGLYRTTYLNDSIYSSKKFLIPTDTSNFDSYAETDDEKPNGNVELSDVKYGLDSASLESIKDLINPGENVTNLFLNSLAEAGAKNFAGTNYIINYYYTSSTSAKTTSQDVILYTNLGKKIINVVGNIPDKNIMISVPNVDGYKKGNVVASIDKNGNITLKNSNGTDNDEDKPYVYAKETNDSGSTSTDTHPSSNTHTNSSTSNSTVDTAKSTVVMKKQLISTAIHEGFVSLYKIDGTDISKVTNQALGAFSDWKSDETITINNQKYYRVATNEWVKAQKVYVYKPLKIIINTDQNWVYMKDNVLKDITNRALDAKTSWNVDRIAYLGKNSTPYYRVATNEFVDPGDVKF